MEELVKLAQKSESEVSKLNPRFIKNSCRSKNGRKHRDLFKQEPNRTRKAAQSLWRYGDLRYKIMKFIGQGLKQPLVYSFSQGK